MTTAHTTSINPEKREKRCPRCNLWKAFSEFNKDASKSHGLKSYCKPCSRRHSAEYYDANAETLTAAELARRASSGVKPKSPTPGGVCTRPKSQLTCSVGSSKPTQIRATWYLTRFAVLVQPARRLWQLVGGRYSLKRQSSISRLPDAV
jgi:hypothetical protein